MFLTGILQALGLVFIAGLYNVLIRFGTVAFDMEAIVFACISIVSASLMLSLFAGPGRLVTDTLKTASTWFYGVTSVLNFVLDVYLAKYVSATEMSLFGRMAIPVSLFVTYVIFRRKGFKNEILGLSLVMIGLAMLVLMQSPTVMLLVFMLALAAGLVQAGEVIFAETHKQSHTAHTEGNMRDRARVVGFVSFITSMMFLGFVMALAVVHEYWLPNEDALNFLPPLERFAHAPSIWFGLFYGMVLSSTFRYLFWSSSYKLKSDNILALMAFVPIITFVNEWLLSFHPLFASNESMFAGDRGFMLLICTVIITLGSGLSFFLRVRHQIQKERTGSLWGDMRKAMFIEPGSMAAIEQADHALDDFEVICATLELADEDTAKAADMLDISESTLVVLFEGKGRLALNENASKVMHRRFRTHVANRDGLTGLLNRSGFMVALKARLEDVKQGAAFYIDLDKFKPVNDTYGHDAGDAVLIEVGHRLRTLLPDDALLTRMGGDEYCIFVSLISSEDAKTMATLIEATISEPYKVKGVSTKIEIGASVGLAFYPENGTTPAALVTAADEGMYGAKHADVK